MQAGADPGGKGKCPPPKKCEKMTVFSKLLDARARKKPVIDLEHFLIPPPPPQMELWICHWMQVEQFSVKNNKHNRNINRSKKKSKNFIFH